MLPFLQKYLLPIATPKTLGLVAIPLFVMVGVVLPGAEADLKSFSSGLGSLDLLFYYTPDTAWHYLEAYGKHGRSLYLFCELTADVVYPVFYTVFLLTLTLWLMKKSGHSMQGRAWLIPLIPMIFDLLENGMLATMLFFYPQKLGLVAALAGVFTAGKWVALGATLLMIAWMSGKWWRRKVILNFQA